MTPVAILILGAVLEFAGGHVIPDLKLANGAEFHEVVYNVSEDCHCQTDHLEGLSCYGVKCWQIPGDLLKPTGKLRITGAALNHVTSEHFSSFGDILELQLDSNEISSIENGSFANLSRLVNLSLSYNELSSLDPETFTGLDSLKLLRLSNNKFTSLANVTSALGPSVLPSLRHLILDDNGFGKVNSEDFKSLEGSALETLRLRNCDLTYIHYTAFQPLKQLRNLDLRENTIPEYVLHHLLFSMKTSTVQSLDLSRTGLSGSTISIQLFEDIAGSNITDLRLGLNNFPRLSAKTFPDKLTKIQHLDLQQCRIIAIENATFSGFTRLKTLNLAENTLLKVTDTILLPQLEHLSLKDNSDEDSSGGQFEIRDNVFSNMTRLRYLDLSLNRIIRLTRFTFVGLKSLEELNLTRCHLHRIEKGSFEPLVSLKVLHLSWNSLENENITRAHFRGLNRLEVLDLSSSKITGFGEQGLFTETPNLKYLILKHNRIKFLSPNPFLSAPTLVSVDLSGNTIHEWTTPLFTFSKLELLRLSRNRISTVTEAMVEDFQSMGHVDLRENPFDCDCKLDVLLKFLNPDHEGNVSITMDHCISPDEWREKLVTDFLDEMLLNHCNISTSPASVPEHSPATVTFLYGMLAILVLLVVSGVTVYRFRWYLRYQLFLSRMRKAHDKSPCISRDDFQYDAFVSYSAEDHSFVVRLLNLLENQAPYFKLCIFERDFTAGTVLNECILQSIASSRKVVLVVSENFVRSQWCLWELHLAQHRLLEEKREGLILIKLGHVKKSSISPTLRYLMRTRIYLEWDPDPLKQRLFWARLRNSLARPSKTFQLTV